MSSDLERFPDGVQDQDSHSTQSTFWVPHREKPDRYSGMTLLPERTLHTIQCLLSQSIFSVVPFLSTCDGDL